MHKIMFEKLWCIVYRFLLIRKTVYSIRWLFGENCVILDLLRKEKKREKNRVWAESPAAVGRTTNDEGGKKGTKPVSL